MSQRGLVLTICIIGAAFIAIFFLRSHKEDADLSAKSEETAQEDSATSASDAAGSITAPATTKSQTKKSTASETVSSSSSMENSMPPRGARGNHPAGGKKTYDISHAQTRDDASLAGTGWKVWIGVAAYPKAQGERSGKVLGEVNGFYLVEEDTQSSSENFDPAKPFVVLNKNGVAGVVTGTFGVTLEEGASAAFLSSSQIKMVGSFPDIQTYYVTSSQVPFSLKEFKEALGEAPEVKEVKMEILDRQYEKF